MKKMSLFCVVLFVLSTLISFISVSFVNSASSPTTDYKKILETLKKEKPSIEYFITSTGDKIEDPSHAKGKDYIKLVRQKRGNIRLVQYIIFEKNNTYKIVYLYINNKLLIDREDKEGNQGADGKFEAEFPY